MKTLRFLMLALLLPAFIIVGCDKGGDEEKPTYTVTFDADGGTPAPAPQKVGEGQKATAPAAMTKSGYTFLHWSKDGAAAYDFTTPVTANFTLTAKWEAEVVADLEIEIPNESELIQEAFADDETTGGFTFTAKSAWTATVTESGATRATLSGESATRASNVPWLRLLWDGEETYSGAAGTFNLVIELDENYSGETRTATITIKSGNDTITITVTQDGKTEEGEVPVEPGKPVPDGMRYVSRIDVGYDYDYSSAHVFEYDSRNRVSRVITEYTGQPYGDISFSYNDANRTITINYGREDGDDLAQAPVVFELNASGAVVASKSSDGNGTFTYADGYLSKFIFNSEEWGEEVFTMTWSGGNKTRMVHEYKSADEYGNYNTYSTNLTYNASWPNNPLCNLDLNALFASFDDGIYGEYSYPEFLGLFGKRSQHMVSGVVHSTDDAPKEYKFTVEYDADGFVTKITQTRGANKEVYTITYR